MRSLLLASLLIAATGVPSLAAGSNDQGLITTKGTINSTCSVDDLHIDLQKEGNNKLTGKGKLKMSQTGRTKWAIGTTDHQHGGSNYSNLLKLELGGKLNMTSTDKNGVSNKYVDGAFDSEADVEVTLTAKGPSFAPGTYGTQTTVLCVVQ